MDKAVNSARPGEGLKTEKMPGHWVLARLGKRVLRPGGTQLSHRMLEALRIERKDDVVEFAPGMGITARLTLECPCTTVAFDAKTGNVLYGPSPRPLDPIKLEVRADGEVWACSSW